MRLEFRCIFLCSFFWILWLCFIFIRYLFSILVKFLGLDHRRIWSDEENFFCCQVANRIAIEDITSVLAVILA